MNNEWPNFVRDPKMKPDGLVRTGDRTETARPLFRADEYLRAEISGKIRRLNIFITPDRTTEGFYGSL
jgi:hypothetical protein